ncbi:helix-turn-helix domain-containing protein [Mesorhizobium sp. B2-5-11]|uniref:helix-turn-helix domain-containing protein n=1 Tax=Mesorhizobium sp. B2-5-11 TaxID=2589919 RepID=UPI00112D28AA|nr:helix-turn-helix domain-containing protein [Mesorhizobium sp. B2-5-11]TPK14140.1 helix-turn-helix domain-containing protein [Mesorhizobium sp. B2-5-11]
MAHIHPLIEFSKRTGKSITAIAKDAECSRMTLYRIMDGANTTTDQLRKIIAACDGEVPFEAFMAAGEAKSEQAA